MRFLSAVLMVFFLTTSLMAEEKVYIDIGSPGGRKIPAAIQEFAVMETSVEDAKKLSDVKKELYEALAGDVRFTGFFDIIKKEAYLEDPSMLKEIAFNLWRAVGAEIVIKGGIKIKDDKLTVEFRLYDCVKEIQLIGRRYTGSISNPGKIAHAFSDDLMEKLTGVKGIFSTKLAFVSDESGSKEIYISDYGGKNLRQITKNKSINLSPQWSPDGEKILYTSYVSGNAHLYIYDIKKNSTLKVSDKPGINIGARWSPDGKRIALTLSGKKSPELFILNLENNEFIQLTDNYSIDVSPSWSPDGKTLAFTSNMAGKPHIYVITSKGGNPRRITFEGSYNTSPSWSPDGNTIAYTRMDGGIFNIYLMTENGGNVKKLTFDGTNEAPSWSADGRHIVFSGKKEGWESSLYMISRNGGNIIKIDPTAGDEILPAWSPYLKD